MIVAAHLFAPLSAPATAPGGSGLSLALRLALVAGLTAAIVPPPAAAAAPDPARSSPMLKACIARSGGVTASMRSCLADEYGRLDRQLNSTYRAVMKQLPTADLRGRLVQSQRVWIWRRDDVCRTRAASSPGAGGTAGDLVYDDCRVTMVRQRIDWLRMVPANPGYLTKV